MRCSFLPIIQSFFTRRNRTLVCWGIKILRQFTWNNFSSPAKGIFDGGSLEMCTANPRVFLTSELGIISSTKVLPKPSRILFGREAEKGKIRTIPRTVQAVRYRTKIHHNFGKIMVTYTLHTVHRFLFLIFPARGPLSLVCMFISSSQEGVSSDIERTLLKD